MEKFNYKKYQEEQIKNNLESEGIQGILRSFDENGKIKGDASQAMYVFILDKKVYSLPENSSDLQFDIKGNPIGLIGKEKEDHHITKEQWFDMKDEIEGDMIDVEGEKGYMTKKGDFIKITE